MKKYVCVPNSETIDFWIKNNLNVLFYGRHGVGKTSLITDGFERNKLKYLQFSAATMDPWVDFIGVPKEVKDANGSYLELIRPKAFRDDEVEALFFDELNRSHKKVRNAVMELIQFKSINGKKFPHLKMIWGAVNPDDDDETKYDVEKLDPAQADRFQIQIEIPYKPHVPYFREKYGRDISEAAIDWWNELPPNLKLEVSPRRLEYAIQFHKSGGNLLHVLPPTTNIDKLQYSLRNGSPIRDFRDLISEGNEEKIKSWLQIENNYSAVQSEIIKRPEKCLHFLSEERICSLLAINNKVMEYVFANSSKYIKTIETLANDSQNRKIKNKASLIITQIKGTKNVSINRSYTSVTVKKYASKLKNYKWNVTNADVNFAKNAKRFYNLDANLPAIINSISKSPRQTPEKTRIFISVIKIVENTPIMSEDEANTALDIIEWFCSKSQFSSIKRFLNIVPTINKCILVKISSNTNYKVEDFLKKYPNICGKTILNMPNENWCIIQ